MKTKLFTSKNLILLGFAFIISIFGCNKVDTPNENDVLVGKFTWSEWQKGAGWSDYSAPNYNPTKEITDTISNLMANKDISFIIFGSSWCPDCASEMPKIMKLFKLAGFDQEKVVIYGLDKAKTEPTGTHLQYEIKRVPTLIILVANGEIDRIVEFPKVSWENDLLSILEK